MNSSICNSCRVALRQSLRARAISSRRSNSSSAAQDISEILAKPSWSVRSLLPSVETTSTSSSETISSKTLHHLLRLSALPPPRSAEEEERMLSTLQSQLHFVHAVREVDTTGVEPLRAIRDETAEGIQEQTIGLEQLKDALANEEIVGHARRPRRRRGGLVGLVEREGSVDTNVENWDILGNASETAGRYFVVRTGSSVQAKASNQAQ
ncbi:hypothetical protein M426DRAFT_138400 [Hypoxylon sp. CI-4A]|nr:hypothetical protein M426DRAFT_138400 [Hypoxylon sp. CI-4A]